MAPSPSMDRPADPTSSVPAPSMADSPFTEEERQLIDALAHLFLEQARLELKARHRGKA